VTPKTKVRFAQILLVFTLVVTPINVVLYRPMHVITDSDLILITLVLSWFAITLTAVDVLFTADVRQEQDSDTSEITESTEKCGACGK
jgi:hypothetical protein